MGDQLGQSFVVENRSGAGGAIGVDAVAKAAPDGYTLLAGASSAMVMLPIVLTRKLPYDENKDFAPIGVISRSPFLLVASQASGIRDLPDLIAKAKAHPGKITYGSAGPGTNPHLLGELLSQLAGIELTHVPYKGPAAAQADLMGGTIDLLFDTPSSALPHVKSGKTVAIAASSDARVTDAPDVPTLKELGYPSLTLYGWTGLYAPAGTPPETLARLRGALSRRCTRRRCASSSSPAATTSWTSMATTCSPCRSRCRISGAAWSSPAASGWTRRGSPLGRVRPPRRTRGARPPSPSHRGPPGRQGHPHDTPNPTRRARLGLHRAARPGRRGRRRPDLRIDRVPALPRTWPPIRATTPARCP